MSNLKIFLPVIALVLNSTFAQGADNPGELAFKLGQGFGIIVRGEIGSAKDLNFLLDTGAVPSVLGQRAAVRMGIRGERGSLTLLNKESQAEYVTVDDVQVGWIRAARLPMVVVELAHLERRLGTRIDAIIGLDMLAGQDISIDYKHRKITRGLSGLARHSVAVETFIASGAPYWVVPISLGGVGFRVLLDTGANDLGLFTLRDSKLFKLVRSETIAHDSAVGDQKAFAMPPMTLALSDAKFKNQVAVIFGEVPVALREIDGVLGPTALGITRIELDWEQKCLRWDTQ
ncbi:MAG TPA: pepsin/retropepsin-like aspartic protease family protein [Candidatus Limnocylindrales bacterium]|nr:pepsin/retropepsin-like aspartic protease family protein [Candidatus Limnocylindrales bacterium]